MDAFLWLEEGAREFFVAASLIVIFSVSIGVLFFKSLTNFIQVAFTRVKG
ncbi:hypothetical protein ACFL35_16745 [Candidatus Riflebacteria bacterium]